MSQITLGGLTTLNLSTHLDPMFTDLYSGVLIASGNPIGFTTGSGGAVTQATSKTTGVTLNKNTGVITMNSAALAAGAVATFTLTNSQATVVGNCIVNLLNSGVANPANYRVWATMDTGLVLIHLENRSGGSLSEAVILQFTLIRGANA